MDRTKWPEAFDLACKHIGDRDGVWAEDVVSVQTFFYACELLIKLGKESKEQVAAEDRQATLLDTCLRGAVLLEELYPRNIRLVYGLGRGGKRSNAPACVVKFFELVRTHVDSPYVIIHRKSAVWMVATIWGQHHTDAHQDNATHAATLLTDMVMTLLPDQDLKLYHALMKVFNDEEEIAQSFRDHINFRRASCARSAPRDNLKGMLARQDNFDSIKTILGAFTRLSGSVTGEYELKLRALLLRNGNPRWISKLLRTLIHCASRDSEGEVRETQSYSDAVEACLLYFQCVIGSGDGARWAVAPIRHGLITSLLLLGQFLECLSRKAQLTYHNLICGPLVVVMRRREVMDAVFAALPDGAIRGRKRPLGHCWKAFEEKLSLFVSIRGFQKARDEIACFVCNNVSARLES